MKVKINYKKILSPLLTLILSFGVATSIVSASQSNGTILNSTYSTSAVCSDSGCTPANRHRVNWKPTLVNDVQAITIVDGSGIRGQAWGEKLGWINFSITASNNAVPTTINTNTGAITGYAWANNSGWINFSPSVVNDVTGVSINSSGEFVGSAWVSGINGGFMRFDCSGAATTTCVKTDWIPVPSRTVVSGGGSGGAVAGGVVIVCLDPKALNYNTLQTCIYSVKNGEKLIGGINPNGGNEYEPNVPVEFQKYVCKRYLRSYIYPDLKNKEDDVKKLQSFLIENENENIKITGTYDKVTIDAVKRFQNKYKDQILEPWGFIEPTGVVGRTTVIKINLLSCATKTGCPYFKTYMKQGDKSIDAVRIQDFLNIINAPTNGYPTKGIALTKEFTRPTFNSVKEFQSYFKKTVLDPWGLTAPTGWWYQTTSYAANKLMNCEEGEIKLDNGKTHKW